MHQLQLPVAYRRRFQVDSINTSKSASEDMISRMPENVITNVLDRLPLQEAVRTSILSRNWRFTWTLLTQLVFDDEFFRYLLSKKLVHLFYKRNIDKVLLQLKGSITKFVLYIPAEEQRKRMKEYNTMYADIVENINHWILFLSTKRIKEFTLINMRPQPVKLPNHLFSCVELKHLYLRNCCLHFVPGFHCFPKLLSLEFYVVKLHGCKYGEFITRCPLLENLEIKDNTPPGDVKLGEIAKLINLKRLSLRFCKLGDTVVTSSDILHLVGSLPKLENLDLYFGRCMMRLSANLNRLKTLELKDIDFENHIMVECARDLINGLPNLQILKMSEVMCLLLRRGFRRSPELSKVRIKGNLRLQYVEFEFFSGSEIKLRFIESVLAYSPLLKKMVIEDGCDGDHSDRCWSFATKLLKFHRASPDVEIYF